MLVVMRGGQGCVELEKSNGVISKFLGPGDVVMILQSDVLHDEQSKARDEVRLDAKAHEICLWRASLVRRRHTWCGCTAKGSVRVRTSHCYVVPCVGWSTEYSNKGVGRREREIPIPSEQTTRHKQRVENTRQCKTR